MAKAFKNWHEIEKYLKTQINYALDDVADESIKWVQDEIEESVYSVYDPIRYERQKYNGGLTDPDNIITDVQDNTLTITSDRKDGDKNVSYTVVSGEGYDYPVPSHLTDGRPFMDNLKDKMENDKRHVKTLKKSLKNRGFKVL